MRRLSTMLALMLAAVALDANAFCVLRCSQEHMNIDHKLVYVDAIKQTGTARVFKSTDPELVKGVYVVVTRDTDKDTILPETTKVVRHILGYYGMKVVDKPEDATLELKFDIKNLALENAQAQNNTGDSLGKEVAVVGVEHAALKAAASIPGGAVTVLGVASTTGGHYEDFLAMNAEIIPLPISGGAATDVSKSANGFDGFTAITRKGMTDPNATPVDLLLLMTKVWKDKYFVKE